MPEAGLLARSIALADARAHLASGHDVVVPQLLARPAFIDQAAALASELKCRFYEIALLDSKENSDAASLNAADKARDWLPESSGDVVQAASQNFRRRVICIRRWVSPYVGAAVAVGGVGGADWEQRPAPNCSEPRSTALSCAQLRRVCAGRLQSGWSAVCGPSLTQELPLARRWTVVSPQVTSRSCWNLQAPAESSLRSRT
jgi:hypothetical protein